MARVPPEAAITGKRIPGAAPPSRTDRSTPPRTEGAFKTSPGASVNKRSVSNEPAFKSRPGSGSTV